MDSNERHKIGQDKRIPLLTRASMLYGGSTSTRALVLTIPGYGSSIDLMLTQKGQEFVVKRLETFLGELQQRINEVEKDAISIKDEEAVFDLIQTTCESVVRTRSEEKIRRFARLASDYLLHERNWDETEIAISLVAELTDTHVHILQYISNMPASNADEFKGLKVVTVLYQNEGSLPALESKFNYLSSAALKMFCSNLVSKGLLHDEGIGRYDTQALEILVATPLASWFLEKIQVMNNA
tara:strand:- start:209 stop:928 length:720 start_codon:yes stop_codon:yes gene_type:complete